VTDEQADAYDLGYLDQKLPDLEYPEAFVEWSLRGSKLDDVFVLPLTNTLGNVRGLQFRHVEQGRRGYMDYIADKGEAVLFGLAQAMPHVWEAGEVYLVEGAFDLFPIQRIIPGTLATLTAHVSDPLLRVLRRLCSKIWLGYDMDPAGRRASHRFQKEHGRDFEVQIVSYPQVAMLDGRLAKDPGEIWEAWGDMRLREALLSVLRSSNGLE
jgi:DNA primase